MILPIANPMLVLPPICHIPWKTAITPTSTKIIAKNFNPMKISAFNEVEKMSSSEKGNVGYATNKHLTFP